MTRATALAALLSALPLIALPLTVLPLAILPSAGRAQDVDCATAEVQVELTFCAEQDWNAADADLNDAYKIAMSAMKGIDLNLDAADQGAAGALRASQRAWIAFRDNTCAAEGWAFHGGSAEPMVIYQCRARVSAQRAEELGNMAAGD